jgi:hypothetical protein
MQTFYKEALLLPPDELEKEKDDYDTARKELLKRRKNIDRKQSNWQDGMEQGKPDYEPANARYQLREGAREFEHDYRNWYRDINGSSAWHKPIQIVLDVIPKYPVYLINGDDEKAEYQQMRDGGDYRYIRFFSNKLGAGIRTQPAAELLAFYDDQIHDSRVWFMQSTLGGREPWGSYFRYRMIYFGDFANKQLQLISVEGKVVGATATSNRVEYIVEMREEQGHLTEVHKVQDLANGQVQTLLSTAMLPPSDAPGQIAAQQQSQIITSEHQAMLTAAVTRLEQSGIKLV